MAGKIYQGPTAKKIKELRPGDAWLGSDNSGSLPFDSDRNDAMIRALETPDKRRIGEPLHNREETGQAYNKGGMVKHGSSTCVRSKYK